ncbi:MAG: RimJ/RimL family protein N-acetyltransferase [Chlamydiales bacterium]|jgi:RimJ/RimL family protein N-acetyltransferase
MPQNKIIAKSKRLILSPLTMDDLDSMLEIFSDPIAMSFSRVKNREEVKVRIQWNLDSYRDNSFGLWACKLKDSGQFIGCCGILLHPDIGGQEEKEISYHFIRNFWGFGYASEAARACRDYGFETLRVPRLISIIDPLHTASQKVAERMGMKLEKEVQWLQRNFNVFSIGNPSI